MIVDLERRWIDQSKCAGMPVGAFFYDGGINPTDRERAEWEKAKAFCEGCPVIKECARDFLGEPHGVFGGMSPEDRKKVRQKYSLWVRSADDEDKRRYAKLVLQFRAKGIQFQDIARAIGISQSTCQYLVEWAEGDAKRAAERHPEPVKRPRGRPVREFSEEEIAKAIKLRQDGGAIQDIARDLKTSSGNINKLFTTHAPELSGVNGQVRGWPIMPPRHGDGWIRHTGRIIRAYYLGETAEGDWFLMKSPINQDGNSTAWLKAEDVKVLRPVQRNVLYRADARPGGVYETRFSQRDRPARTAG